MQESWAAAEMATLDLGDVRRARRVTAVLEDLAKQPQASIPQASGSWAKTKATYRLLNSQAVAAEAIRQAHIAATRARLKGQPEVLIPQDTTELDFTAQAATEGLGPLANRHCRGLLVHSALALSAEGVPLGLLHQEVWARPPAETGTRASRRRREIREKESWLWLSTALAASEQLPPEVLLAWVIADREADIYALFAQPRRAGVELLIRAAHNRRVAGAEATYLWEAVAEAPLAAEVEVELPRTATRAARRARLEVRFCAVQLLPPRHARRRATLAAVPLWAVWVREVQAPAGTEAVEWLLLSSAPVESLQEALACVERYLQRWKVERYHYVLKSGCKIEELQLESAARIERALALYCVVAWRLLWLTYAARQWPEASCTLVLEEAQWKALALTMEPRQGIPTRAPTLQQGVRWIAQLGGFLGRRHDGEPGVKVLWRGLQRLQDTTATYILLTQTQDVGNG